MSLQVWAHPSNSSSWEQKPDKENPLARSEHTCHISWTKGATLSMSSILIRHSLEVNEKPDFFVFCPILNHSRKEQEDALNIYQKFWAIFKPTWIEKTKKMIQ